MIVSKGNRNILINICLKAITQNPRTKLLHFRLLLGSVRFRWVPLTVFSIALLLRTLPELLSGPYPVGYDVIVGYLPSLQRFPDVAPLRLFGWIWAPLCICIMWTLSTLSFGHIYFFLKVFGPVLYGCLAVSFYLLIRGGLQFGQKESFLTSLFFLLQPGILRIGWDQFREELGLVFFFILIAQTRCDLTKGSQEKPWLVLGLTLLIILTHELVSVLLLAVVLWHIAYSLWTKEKVRRIMAVTMPAASAFGVQVYAELVGFPAFSNSIRPLDALNPVRITNYLAGPPFGASDYFSLIISLISLSIYVLVPVLPLSIVGHFKDKVFLPLVIWLLIGSFNIVAVPQFGIPYFWWWLMLLPIPLTVYSGRGFETLGVFKAPGRFAASILLLLLLAVVSVGYCTSIIRLGYPSAYAYMPSSLVESAVKYSDISSIEQALSWCNSNLPLNGLLIVPENLEGFAATDSRPDFLIRVAPPAISLAIALRSYPVPGPAFAVYNVNEIGAAPVNELATFGDIGVFSIVKVA